MKKCLNCKKLFTPVQPYADIDFCSSSCLINWDKHTVQESTIYYVGVGGFGYAVFYKDKNNEQIMQSRIYSSFEDAHRYLTFIQKQNDN